MRGLVSFVVLAIVLMLACRGARSPIDDGFDSCADPRIKPAARLTLKPMPELYDRIRAQQNRVHSADEANALFANAMPSYGPVAGEPPQDGGTEHDAIDAFIHATDFSREELIYNEAIFYDDPLIGQFSLPGKFVLVERNCSSGGGGMARSQIDWLEVYRVPRGAEVVSTGCGDCGPPPPCCPP